MRKPGLNSARDVLKKYWGYDQFRAGQEEAIKSVLSKNDTVVLFPTGGGKSLCYQIPAVILEGLTLVISPLIALMKDQVDQLNSRNIPATYINSSIPRREIEQRLINARNGMYKLLYLSPERLETESWKSELPALNISLIAIDEAHCISEWGHDFRPSYRNIKESLEHAAGDPAWMALTATATPEVRKDILSTLKFDNPKVITGSFKRENLVWWVNQTGKKQREILRTVKRASRLGSGIIYCATRKDCEVWAEELSSLGVGCLPYHAGLRADKRSEVQQKWVSGEVPLVAATSAFGMGIDKSDCRFVIHETIPFSLEAYYQEAGRAGRDGQEAFPVLIYKPGDLLTLQSRIDRSYPTIDKLKAVYNALCDELNLANGSVQEEPRIVPFKNVAIRSALPVTVVRMSVELFRRLEILELRELREPRVGIRFLVSQEYLMQFIDEATDRKGEFLDLLMRQFDQRAFSQMHYLNRSYLLEKLKVSDQQLENALRVFSERDHILSFEMDKENTLILLNEPRMQRFEIDRKAAYFYKHVLTEKLHYMQRYAETKECREVFLRNYFGETGARPCGRCDNCRKKPEEIPEIQKKDLQQILAILKQQGQQQEEQIRQQTSWSQSKTVHILRYMCREEIIKVSEADGAAVYQLSED